MDWILPNPLIKGKTLWLRTMFGCTEWFSQTHTETESRMIFLCSTLTQLVGKLLTHNGRGRTETCQYGHCERSTDGQPIDEVVQCVAQRYHPCHCFDVADVLATQPVAYHTRCLNVLEQWQDRLKATAPVWSSSSKTCVQTQGFAGKDNRRKFRLSRK